MNGSHFQRASIASATNQARNLHRVFLVRTVDYVEAQQLLLRFCERSIDNHIFRTLLQCSRRGCRHESHDGTELIFRCELALNFSCLPINSLRRSGLSAPTSASES